MLSCRARRCSGGGSRWPMQNETMSSAGWSLATSPGRESVFRANRWSVRAEEPLLQNRAARIRLARGDCSKGGPHGQDAGTIGTGGSNGQSRDNRAKRPTSKGDHAEARGPVEHRLVVEFGRPPSVASLLRADVDVTGCLPVVDRIDEAPESHLTPSTERTDRPPTDPFLGGDSGEHLPRSTPASWNRRGFPGRAWFRPVDDRGGLLPR